MERGPILSGVPGEDSYNRIRLNIEQLYSNMDALGGTQAAPVSKPAAPPIGGLQASITPGTSPWIFQNLNLELVVLVVSGGTVSAIDLSTNGSSWVVTGQTAGAFPLKPGFYIRVTYSVVPTVTGMV